MADTDTFSLPTNMACPRCHEVMVEASPVSPGSSRTLKKGLLMVCSNCAAMLILGDNSFQLLTKEQFDALHPNSKTILAAAKGKVVKMLQEQMNN